MSCACVRAMLCACVVVDCRVSPGGGGFIEGCVERCVRVGAYGRAVGRSVRGRLDDCAIGRLDDWTGWVGRPLCVRLVGLDGGVAPPIGWS